MPNSVYILGAGASKDFGLPLGTEIFDYAYKLIEVETCAVKDELTTLLGDAEKHMREMFTNLPDDKTAYPPLEEILTFLWECRSSETYDYKTNKLISLFAHPKGAGGVFEIFTKVLGLTLVGAMQISQPDTRIELFNSFIRSLISNKEQSVSFISLNYDLLLDNVLAQCVSDNVIPDYTYGVPLYDMEQRHRTGSRQNFCRDAGILLIKPHGSLNLISCPHHQGRYSWGFYYGGSNPIAVTTNPLKCPGCGTSAKALIIPPLYVKSEYVAASKAKTPRVNARATPETYRKWFCDRNITERLTEVDEIFVVGYSLPAYDHDFKSLMMAGLMNNKNRGKLVLRLVTKGDKDAVSLKMQWERLVGRVIVEGSDGFYQYLSRKVRA